MALCKEYTDLSYIEQVRLIGELVHAVQTDSELFSLGIQLRDLAISKGVMNGVTILPEQGKNDQQ